MANIKIKIPSNEIQENISLVINTINHKVNLETNKLLKLQELKKGLMQSMFVQKKITWHKKIKKYQKKSKKEK